MRKFVKKFKNSILGKILKFIFNVLKWAIELFIITIAIIIVVQRVTNNQEAFLGYRIFNVATGSMEPEYIVGDILISKEKDPSTIKVGDNIVYLGNKADYRGKIITHNVIEVEQNEKGEYLFHTKGIANTVEDPVVHEDQLYGIVVNNNEVLAFICKILTNRYGLYFFVIIPIVLSAFTAFVRAQSQQIEEERKEEAEEREKERKRQEMLKEQENQKAQNAEEKEQEDKNKNETIENKKRKSKKEKQELEEELNSSKDSK